MYQVNHHITVCIEFYPSNTKDEIKKEIGNKSGQINVHKPSVAFVGASWVALFAGIISYNVGLWNAEMELNEKGYYFTILIFGLFAAVSVQKNVRDRLEGIKVTDLYYGISWGAVLISIILLVIGLWNATLELSEKGFYGMSFTLSLFSSIAVQKNVRDNQMIENSEVG